MTLSTSNTSAKITKNPKLLDQVRFTLRANRYSKKTEQAYIKWIKEYILFHGKRHPKSLAKTDLEKYLNYLAVERHVSASTQNQALNAVLYLYKKVLNIDIGWLEDVKRAKRSMRLPVVFTQNEISKVLLNLSGNTKLITSIIYGSGLRLGEVLRLRIKDIDFNYV